ncbi:SCR-like protein [Medicago truncatula]|nr:SCR-like protein [Medicago truncatula]
MKLGSILLMVGALSVLFTLTYGSGVDYCLKEIVVDGSCKDHWPHGRDCTDEFINGVGSWTMAKDCQCQQLSSNKRRCQCCINCPDKANVLSDAFHVNVTHDRCSK